MTSDIPASLPAAEYDLDDMQLVGDHLMAIAVPYAAPDALKRKVVAAMKAHVGGYQSIDYVLKKFGAVWTFPKRRDEEIILHEFLRDVKREVERVSKLIATGPVRPEHAGLMAAEAALIRLESTFFATVLLLKQRLAFETVALCRLILEQLSWAYTVHTFEDIDGVIDLKPTKCVSNLKRALPYVGKAYGYLTKHAHMDPETHSRYLSSEDGMAFVRYPSSSFINDVAYAVLIMTDTYRIVSEYVSWDYLSEHLACWKNETGEITLVDKRPFRQLIRDFEVRVLDRSSG
jgi:hypothetical protein